MKIITPVPTYEAALQNIKERIYKAQYNALKAVNKELIQLYWDLGKTISEKQEKEGGPLKDLLKICK